MFRQPVDISLLNQLNKNNLTSYIGIEYTEAGSDYLCAKMPVDHRTHQPYGVLHGGASVVLAETLGSIGSYLCIDETKQFCVGLEVNANHIRSVSSGYVYGKATIVHKGKSTHIWEIKITNESGGLVCISRLTVAVLDKK